MEGDWAEADDLGGLNVGQLSIPEVELPEPPKPETPPPRENAWTRVDPSNDVRRPSGDGRAPWSAGAQGAIPRGRDIARDGRGAPGSGAAEPSPGAGGAKPDGWFARGGGATGPGGALGSAERGGGGGAFSSAGAGGSSGSAIYMSNLPYETSENDVVGFFSQYGVTMADVNLQRRSETGQVHAAVVKLRDAATASDAMGLDGAQFGGRTAHLKIDGADRRSTGGSRGGGFSSGNFVPHGVSSPPGYGDGGQWGGRERKSYGSSGFGGAGPRDGPGDGGGFGSRERKGYGGSSGQYEPAGIHHGGGAFGRDREEGGGGRERRGPGMQAADPTIPQGPPPEGRKKLQLKPRTKPPPKLDIDTRQIDPPRSHAASRSRAAPEDGGDRGAHMPGRGVSGSSARSTLSPVGTSARRTEPSEKADAGVPETGAPNGASPGLNGVGSRTGKEDEKPKFQNTFDALKTEENLDGAEA